MEHECNKAKQKNPPNPNLQFLQKRRNFQFPYSLVSVSKFNNLELHTGEPREKTRWWNSDHKKFSHQDRYTLLPFMSTNL